jgi:REP element-mobilizing transposase RayT
MSLFYENLLIEKYVIMPNHIHVLIFVSENSAVNIQGNGPSGTPVPTIQNSTVSRFVSTFKRFCNKECEENIWQARSYDHIIRDQKDYEEHVNYIYYNPIRWYKEGLHVSEDEES